MSQSPISIQVTYPGSLIDPSYGDVKFLSDSVFGLNGVYDTWCADRTVSLDLVPTGSGTYSATLQATIYSTYELDNAFALKFPTITPASKLDEVNWLLSQHYNHPGNGYTFGEVQAAVWTLLGDDYTTSNVLGARDPVKITYLVNQSNLHDGYTPDITDSDSSNDLIAVLLAPTKLDANNTVQQPLLIEVASAAIGDNVWIDNNANGVHDSDESGIQGVAVNLWRDANGNHSVDSNEILKSTTTDSTGNYKFVGLTPGLEYQVQVVAPTGTTFTAPYALGSDANNNTITNDSNVDGTGLSGVTVLNPGQYNSTIDAGILPFGGISGSILKDADASNGFSAGDTVLSGSVVTLYHADGTTLVSSVAPVLVGNDGTYAFHNLPFGNYVVKEVNPAGFIDVADTANTDGSNANGPNTIAVNLAATAPTSANNNFLDKLFVAPDIIPASVKGFVYVDVGNDGVKGATEAGIGGVTVTLTGTNDLGSAVSKTATTAADGSYRFDNLRPSDATGYTVTETQPTDYDDGKDTAGSTVGSVATNEVISHIVVLSGEVSIDNNFGELLKNNGSISGLVKNDTGATKGAFDGGDALLGGSVVTLTHADGSAVAGVAPFTVGADGSYHFDNLPLDNYLVKEVNPAGFSDVADSDGGDANSIAVALTAAAPASTGNHFLDAQLGSISGLVKNDTGATQGAFDGGDALLGGSQVALYQANGTTLVPGVAAVTVGANGQYTFSNLPLDSYVVKEINPVGFSDVADTDGTGNGPNTIAVSITSTVPNSGGNDFLDVQQQTAPSALASAVTGVEDTVYKFSLADFKSTDANVGDTVSSVTISTLPVEGVIKYFNGTSWVNVTAGQVINAADISANKLEFVPGSNASSAPCDAAGVGNFKQDYAQFQFSVKDSTGLASDNATLTVDITPVADAPTLSIQAPGLATPPASIGLKQQFYDNTTVVDTTIATNVLTVETKLQASVATSTSTASAVNVASLGADDAYQYTGLVYLESGKSYVFSGYFDDTALIKLDGTIVLQKNYNSWGNYTASSFTPTANGYYTVEMIAYNGDGAGSFNAKLTVNNGPALDFNKTNFKLYSSVADLDAAGVAHGTLQANGNGGHYIPLPIDSGLSNTFIKLSSIASALTDTDGSETLSLSIGAIPVGAVLTDGSNTFTSAAGTTTAALSGWNLANLSIKPAADFAGSFDLQVKASAVENCNNDTANTTGAITVNVTAPPTQIGDLIWEDKNANGIQDSGETGIANVTVKLETAAGAVLQTTTTDASGNYHFDVTAGTYKIQVVQPTSYLIDKQNQGSNDNVDSDINTSGISDTVTVTTGQQNFSLDAGLYKLGSIGDKVWDDMNHNSVQDASEPGIANVKIQLKDAISGNVVASTTTDTNGNYLFSGLTPGDYTLTFDKTNVQHYNYGAWYNMNDWKWAPKNVGSNDAIDSDVTGDGVAKTNVTSTDVIHLASGQNDLTWDAGITPLVIDLNGDGVHSVSLKDSQGTFDLLGNGVSIHSGWLASDDGFLAVDTNGNGQIDNIGELFGGNSKGDGFAKLAGYDSNHDGLVDLHDDHFVDLRVWQDANGNHKTDAGELISLDQAGIASLNVGFTELPFLDSNGNLHLERSSATLASGASADVTDLYFNVSNADAAAAGVTLPNWADLLTQYSNAAADVPVDPAAELVTLVGTHAGQPELFLQ